MMDGSCLAGACNARFVRTRSDLKTGGVEMVDPELPAAVMQWSSD